MADTKITALAAIATVDPAADVLPIVDISDTSMAATGTTKKVTSNQILGSGGTATLASATITGAATVGTTLGVTGVSTLTGNVGVGTTSSPWLTGVKAVDIGSNGLCAYSGGITHNAYYDNTDSRWEYKGTGGAAFYNPQNGTHEWFVAASGTANAAITTFATAAMTLNATGNLAFPTGKGIDFSATASGSGTMTSELLADYEEGTFTPVVEGSSTAGSATYSTQNARYTKVGRLVTFSLRVIYTGGTGTGNLRVAGLPFTTGFGANYAIYSENIALTAGYIAVPSSASSVTSIGIDQIPTGGGGALGVPYDAAGDIQISGSYTV